MKKSILAEANKISAEIEDQMEGLRVLNQMLIVGSNKVYAVGSPLGGPICFTQDKNRIEQIIRSERNYRERQLNKLRAAFNNL